VSVVPIVGLLSLELHIPGARSLKEKRTVVRSVKDRLRRLNVAVAELDHQELWQRLALGVVAIGTTRQGVERSLDSVLDEIDRHDPGLVIGSEIEWLT
jgi:uncharacterized protein YlxP (DUF503 family)